MAVFGCARCGAVLTAPVSRVALPVHAHLRYGHQFLPALMEPGTYAVNPEPSGRPGGRGPRSALMRRRPAACTRRCPSCRTGREGPS
jgi:hypothetical protein